MMEGTTIISTSRVVASQKDVRTSIASEIDDLMEDLFAPKYKRAVCDTAAAESAASHTPDTMSPASGIDISPFHSSPNTPAGIPFSDFDDGVEFTHPLPPSPEDSPQQEQEDTDSDAGADAGADADADADLVDPSMLLDPPLLGLGESVLHAMGMAHSGVLVTNLDTHSVLSADDVNAAVLREQQVAAARISVSASRASAGASASASAAGTPWPRLDSDSDSEEEVDLGIAQQEYSPPPHQQHHPSPAAPRRGRWALGRYLACPNPWASTSIRKTIVTTAAAARTTAAAAAAATAATAAAARSKSKSTWPG